jgi:hypothetical protein
MKVALITRIRNEEAIIQDFLDFYSPFCDDIYIYDDVSTDNTVNIASVHPKVRAIIQGKEWDENRTRAEWQTRQKVLQCARNTDTYDWIIYVDADERIDLSPEEMKKYMSNPHIDGIVMKLFDFYITEEDKDKTYKDRKWLGQEYREILMAYRNLPDLKYEHEDQREMVMPNNNRLLYAGYVKHYGKAISIEEWEKTCEYYATHFPEPYKSKWEARKGKAIHTQSDFGNKLITWDMKEDWGFPM